MEYGLLSALVAVAAITGIMLVGHETTYKFEQLSGALTDGGGIPAGFTDALTMFDSNNDGLLSATEVGAPPSDFAQVDGNGDGFMDQSEYDAMMANGGPPPAPPGGYSSGGYSSGGYSSGGYSSAGAQ